MSEGRQKSVAARGAKSRWSRVFAQMIGVLGLGTLLGLAFNASNPVGIRFSDPSVPGSGIASTAVLSSGVSGSVSNGSVAPLNPVGATPKNLEAAPLSSTSSATTPDSNSVVSRQNPAATTWAKTQPLLAAGSCVLVDARSAAAFEAGHIPGAELLSQTSTDDEIRAFSQKHDPNTHVVVYCSSTSCSLSFKLASRLVNDFKFQNVEFMTGGYMEWQRATGIPVEAPPTVAALPASAVRSPPDPNLALGSPVPSAPVLPDSSAMAAFRPVGIRLDELAGAFPQQLPQMVDIRSAEVYDRGHIDGAVRAGDSSDAEISTLLKNLGPERALVVYSERPGSLDALKFGTRLRLAGFKKVRYLEDGYQGWLARASQKK